MVDVLNDPLGLWVSRSVVSLALTYTLKHNEPPTTWLWLYSYCAPSDNAPTGEVDLGQSEIASPRGCPDGASSDRPVSIFGDSTSYSLINEAKSLGSTAHEKRVPSTRAWSEGSYKRRQMMEATMERVMSARRVVPTANQKKQGPRLASFPHLMVIVWMHSMLYEIVCKANDQ